MARFSVQMLADILCSYAEIGLKDDTLLQAAAQVCSSIELNNWGLGLIDASDECVLQQCSCSCRVRQVCRILSLSQSNTYAEIGLKDGTLLQAAEG